MEDDVTATGNFVAMMMGGRSTISMNLIRRQEITRLGCQMTTFIFFPLSMNLSVVMSISRPPLCQNKAVLARKTKIISFFPFVTQNAEENLDGDGRWREWSYTNGGTKDVRKVMDSYTHGQQKQLSHNKSKLKRQTNRQWSEGCGCLLKRQVVTRGRDRT